MSGATGNIYCGLHEFADMGFLLHFLRPDDLFIDIGANIGSYTVLASGVVGARSWAIEPDPSTVEHLVRNVEVNGIGHKVVVCPFALGDKEVDLPFTIGLDTVNRVAAVGDSAIRMVKQSTLDALTERVEPRMIKMDVEGYEEIVLKGASATLRKASLQAVESEAASKDIEAVLVSAGFSHAFYDPFTRELSDRSCGPKSANALFIKDWTLVRERVRSAQRVCILGHLL
jgi:FkbM family methyltransferase